MDAQGSTAMAAKLSILYSDCRSSEVEKKTIQERTWQRSGEGDTDWWKARYFGRKRADSNFYPKTLHGDLPLRALGQEE